MKRVTSLIVSSDVYILWLMNQKVRCTILDCIMPIITHLGGAIFTIFFSLSTLLSAMILKHSTNLGWKLTASLSLSHFFVHVVKRKVNRPRPHTVLEIIEKFNVPICNYSFPSGHTTAAFAIANILAMNVPSLRIIFMGTATLVGISRMYLGVHYPTDVIAGIGIATLSSIITQQLL